MKKDKKKDNIYIIKNVGMNNTALKNTTKGKGSKMKSEKNMSIN